MYEFAYRTPVAGGILRSTHALEIPFVWDNLDAAGAATFVGDVGEEQRSCRQLADAWVAFARDGEPGRTAYRLAPLRRGAGQRCGSGPARRGRRRPGRRRTWALGPVVC